MRGRRHPAWPPRSGAPMYRRMLSERGRDRVLGALEHVARVVNTFLLLRDRDREYQLVLDWLGFSSSTLEFAHAERPAGKSAYGLARGLLGVALGGMFFLARPCCCAGSSSPAF